mmetsp:Transcript_2219/g.6327  ORF Transcript_2219/g.6327 Transcript_2219/m.6327 type:complete len:224 (+) Transcript_2219:345-1016(+)
MYYAAAVTSGGSLSSVAEPEAHPRHHVLQCGKQPMSRLNIEERFSAQHRQQGPLRHFSGRPLPCLTNSRGLSPLGYPLGIQPLLPVTCDVARAHDRHRHPLGTHLLVQGQKERVQRGLTRSKSRRTWARDAGRLRRNNCEVASLHGTQLRQCCSSQRLVREKVDIHDALESLGSASSPGFRVPKGVDTGIAHHRINVAVALDNRIHHTLGRFGGRIARVIGHS